MRKSIEGGAVERRQEGAVGQTCGGTWLAVEPHTLHSLDSLF